MPGRKYTAQEDENLVRYLAHPSRIDANYSDIKVYEELGGPQSPHPWSRERNTAAWCRRAKVINGLSGRIWAARKKARDAKEGYALHIAKPSKDKKGKGRATELDVAEDLDAIAADSTYTEEAVRVIFKTMKSVVLTQRVVQVFEAEKAHKASRRRASDDEDDEDDSSSDESSDGDEDDDDGKRSIKGSEMKVKKRQEPPDEDEDEVDQLAGDSDAVESPRRAGKAKAVEPTSSDDDSDEEEDQLDPDTDDDDVPSRPTRTAVKREREEDQFKDDRPSPKKPKLAVPKKSALRSASKCPSPTVKAKKAVHWPPTPPRPSPPTASGSGTQGLKVPRSPIPPPRFYDYDEDNDDEDYDDEDGYYD
ncbi:hypothetical protein C8R46DRAFT_289626 [Mycena filopes]|nr:hypothetical protein C8R46DRAFT_289626 [Mycena filopes]